MSGPRAGERLDLVGTSLLGRGPDCDLRVDDDMVSRHHARFTVSGDSVTVEDLKSTNGTHVNGQRIRVPRGLGLGDTVQVGELRTRLVSPDSPGIDVPAPLPPPPPPPPQPVRPRPTIETPPPQPQPLPHPPERPVARFTEVASSTDGTAIGALVLAVGAYVVLPFIAAVIALYLANKAKENIAASNGALKGEWMVTLARVLAWINIVLCLLAIAAMVLIFIVFATSTSS